jgi:hypothetical protein
MLWEGEMMMTGLPDVWPEALREEMKARFLVGL